MIDATCIVTVFYDYYDCFFFVDMSISRSYQVRKILSYSKPLKCAFSNCLHLGEPGCLVKTDWERHAYYFQLLDEIKIREEFQLRTLGTKREGDVRYAHSLV